MLHNLKRLLYRYWFFGFIAVALHYAVFRIHEFFGWPPGSILDYLDGAGFQLANTVELLFDRIRNPNEHMAVATWLSGGLAVVSLGWFILGILLPSLWPFGLKRNDRRELAWTAVRCMAFFMVLVVGWYAIVVVNTYWGTIKSLGRHYIDCGTIGNWPAGDAREVENKRKLQAAFKESRNAKILAHEYGLEYEYLALEFGRKRCTLCKQLVFSRRELSLRDLDIRGWGRTLTYDVDSITIIDRVAAEDLMGPNWVPLNQWQEFLAIKIKNAPTLVY
jgi:hypothetical protein